MQDKKDKFTSIKNFLDDLIRNDGREKGSFCFYIKTYFEEIKKRFPNAIFDYEIPEKSNSLCEMTILIKVKNDEQWEELKNSLIDLRKNEFKNKLGSFCGKIEPSVENEINVAFHLSVSNNNCI